jgi:hypothetical protein
MTKLLGTITIPGRAASQNYVNSMGMRLRMRSKKKWRMDATLLCYGIKKPDGGALTLYGHNPSKRRIVVTSYRKRLLDNAAESLAGGACKHYIDGLVDAGVLWRDSEEWCEREYRQVKIEKKVPALQEEERTVIEVFEI